MKRFLFFCYRDWAIKIFNKVSKDSKDQFILCTDKSLCTESFINEVNPDIIFFYGWSDIIKESIIKENICLCLHPSILPKYRGGSPIQNQIINGESVSAVTIFKMTKELDAGPICFQEVFYLIRYLDFILNTITDIGYRGTLKVINDLKNNQLAFFGQNGTPTYCKRRTPKQSEIKLEDFLEKDAKYLYDKVRCLQDPYPLPFIKCKKGKLIIKEVLYEQDQEY